MSQGEDGVAIQETSNTTTTTDNGQQLSSKRRQFNNKSNTVIESLVTGSISSVVTTIVYQPLELIKTRIQIQDANLGGRPGSRPIVGRVSYSALGLIKTQGLSSLWRGTGASLMRSGPGVGLYYALLNVLQSNFSHQNTRPDSPTQAFYFGLVARSMVSFVLLPITVVKVRYESGRFQYPSLAYALKNAYLKRSLGWVGVTPTILRDSLFSGIYYMCYTKLKSSTGQFCYAKDCDKISGNTSTKQHYYLRNFSNGILSGLIASILTNPIDVLKTNIQIATGEKKKNGVDRASMRQVTRRLLSEPRGYLRFFDGVVPRSVRRTLIAASTWTFYELMIELVNNSKV